MTHTEALRLSRLFNTRVGYPRAGAIVCWVPRKQGWAVALYSPQGAFVHAAIPPRDRISDAMWCDYWLDVLEYTASLEWEVGQ